jgi:hypothetical protein
VLPAFFPQTDRDDSELILIVYNGHVAVCTMAPGPACSHDYPNSEKDHGANLHIEYGSSRFDCSPCETGDKDDETEDVCKKSHEVHLGFVSPSSGDLHKQ